MKFNKGMYVVLMCLVVLAPQFLMAGGLGTYSEGYRMGQLTKFSIKGLMFKSGEGQMLMGSESTPYVITTKDSKGKTSETTINPWYFSSTNTRIHELLNKNMGEYCVLQYTQAQIKNPNVDTPYEIVNVLPIDESPVTDVCVATAFTDGSKSEGTRVGRFVKASTKGMLSKSYEIIIQQGNSGNQFKSLSISEDTALYECALKYLKAGQKAKITYNQSHINLNVMSRDTAYDIVKIEPVKGLN